MEILYQKSVQPMLCLDVLLWPAAMAFGKVLSWKSLDLGILCPCLVKFWSNANSDGSGNFLYHCMLWTVTLWKNTPSTCNCLGSKNWQRVHIHTKTLFTSSYYWSICREFLMCTSPSNDLTISEKCRPSWPWSRELWMERKSLKKNHFCQSHSQSTCLFEPDTLLHLVMWGCESEMPCSSSRHEYNNAQLPCTLFCACHNIGCCSTYKVLFIRNCKVKNNSGKKDTWCCCMIYAINYVM